MSYNGSGTFVINTAGQPVVSGTVISSTAFNALTADLATGLSTAITKDGQTTPTANIPMGNNKITGLAVGTAATDAANLSQVQSTTAKLINSISGTDTITGTMSPTLGAYATGQMFYFIAAGDNTGAVTLNIDSLGAKAVTRDGSVALAASDLKSGEVVVVVYDGTRFQVVSQLNSAGDARFANVSIASALNVGGVATFSAGTAAAPSITTSGDTNTGIFFPAADTIAFAEGGVEAARFDSSGNLGIGTSSPAYKLDVSGTLRATGDSVIGAPSGGFAARLQLGQSSANTEVCLLSLQNTATETATTGARIDFGGASNWLGRISTRFVGSTGGGNSTLSLYTASGGTIYERLLIDQNGNLGLGVTPSAWGAGSNGIEISGYNGQIVATTPYLTLGSNTYYNGSNYIYKTSGTAAYYQQNAGTHLWYTAPSGTAGNTISFTQAMTLDSSARLTMERVADSAFTLRLTGNQDSFGIWASNGVASGGSGTSKGRIGLYYDNAIGNENGAIEFTRGGSATDGEILFRTNGSARARITSNGDFLVGKSSAGSAATAGCEFGTYGAILTRVSGDPLTVNRQTNDGTIVSIRQDNVEEGSISVSGNTVSYNAFAGSHWSQLQDGSKPDILRGTVMESINELCVWPGEENERLPKSKISDTAGSKKVYGVFMAWDNDWTTTNDMYVTAVGAFICRVNGSVTVEEGDLLESNGDGTARVQADDIIRSSTIGKVTSTVKTHQYDDGSYCVPTVLYCG